LTIRYLEEAVALGDEIGDRSTRYLIKRVLDKARAKQFQPSR